MLPSVRLSLAVDEGVLWWLSVGLRPLVIDNGVLWWLLWIVREVFFGLCLAPGLSHLPGGRWALAGCDGSCDW